VQLYHHNQEVESCGLVPAEIGLVIPQSLSPLSFFLLLDILFDPSSYLNLYINIIYLVITYFIIIYF
jgi:hypothetical protein